MALPPGYKKMAAPEAGGGYNKMAAASGLRSNRGCLGVQQNGGAWEGTTKWRRWNGGGRGNNKMAAAVRGGPGGVGGDRTPPRGHGGAAPLRFGVPPSRREREFPPRIPQPPPRDTPGMDSPPPSNLVPFDPAARGAWRGAWPGAEWAWSAGAIKAAPRPRPPQSGERRRREGTGGSGGVWGDTGGFGVPGRGLRSPGGFSGSPKCSWGVLGCPGWVGTPLRILGGRGGWQRYWGSTRPPPKLWGAGGP